MPRTHVSRAFALALVFASVAWAQQNPLEFANAALEGCGRVGQLLHQSSGSGTRGGVTTKYLSASFEIECVDSHLGQLDIQTADNELTVVTYRQQKGEPESQSISGTNTPALVQQAIRGACSCATN